MPIVSSFYGITIRMQKENVGKHHCPHLHAVYGEYEAVYSLKGKLLGGGLPGNKRKLVEAWIVIHEDELLQNWNLLANGDNIIKIKPLI